MAVACGERGLEVLVFRLRPLLLLPPGEVTSEGEIGDGADLGIRVFMGEDLGVPGTLEGLASMRTRRDGLSSAGVDGAEPFLPPVTASGKLVIDGLRPPPLPRPLLGAPRPPRLLKEPDPRPLEGAPEPEDAPTLVHVSVGEVAMIDTAGHRIWSHQTVAAAAT